MIVKDSSNSKSGSGNTLEFEITFFDNDTAKIYPHENDSMVITIPCDFWEIKRVLNDQGNSTDIIHYDTFERLELDPKNLRAFHDSFASFYGE